MTSGLRADAVRSRDRILAAAAEVFADDPNAPVEAVVARSGVGRATVYRHFPTRDDLVAVVATRALDAVADQLARARPGEGPAVPALRRLTAAAWAAGRSAMALVSLVAGGQVGGPDLPGAGGVDGVVADLVERGRGEGALRTDVPTIWLVDVWFATLQSALLHPPPDGTDAPELVMALFLDAAGGTAR